MQETFPITWLKKQQYLCHWRSRPSLGSAFRLLQASAWTSFTADQLHPISSN